LPFSENISAHEMAASRDVMPKGWLSDGVIVFFQVVSFGLLQISRFQVSLGENILGKSPSTSEVITRILACPL